MARKPRIHFSGALYYVVLRGNGGQKIFCDLRDRKIFYALVEEGVKRFGHVIYAYCWMENYVRFAIEVDKIPLSKIIQNLSFRYTRYINRKTNTRGHLFQGRYKAILVEKDAYLLELIRYIHLNSVRAKLIDKPEAYLWSSHRCYLGLDTISWLEAQKPLRMYSTKKEIAIKTYIKFIREGLRRKGRIDFEKGQSDNGIVGDNEFIDNVIEGAKNEGLVFSLDLIIKITCKILFVSRNELMRKTRRREVTVAKYVVAYINKHYGDVAACDLAQLLCLEPSTLCKAINKLEVSKECEVVNAINEIVGTCKIIMVI